MKIKRFGDNRFQYEELDDALSVVFTCRDNKPVEVSVNAYGKLEIRSLDGYLSVEPRAANDIQIGVRSLP